MYIAQECKCSFKTSYKGTGSFYRFRGWIFEDTGLSPSLCTSVRLYDSTDLKYSCCTDSSGFYMVQQIKPGRYTIEIENNEQKWVLKNFYAGHLFEDSIKLSELNKLGYVKPRLRPVNMTFFYAYKDPIKNTQVKIRYGKDSLISSTDEYGKVFFDSIPVGLIDLILMYSDSTIDGLKAIRHTSRAPISGKHYVEKNHPFKEYNYPLIGELSRAEPDSIPSSYYVRLNTYKTAEKNYSTYYGIPIRNAELDEHKRREKKKSKKKRQKKRNKK